MKKLKTEDQVLYWDGYSILELTRVVGINKEKSQAKLENGVILHRSPDEEGVFHRADYKEKLESQETNRKRRRSYQLSLTYIAKAWLYEGDDLKDLWEAYKFKRSFANTYEELKKKITLMRIPDIVENIEFIKNVKKAMENIK